MRKAILIACMVIALAVPLTTSATENDTYISEVAQEACVEYGEQYGICPELLMAIIEAESSGRPYAKNGSCKGLMQIRYLQDRQSWNAFTESREKIWTSRNLKS